MLLAIDIGNTNIVCAVFDGQDKKDQWRCETSGDITDLFDNVTDIDDVIISSVVPRVNGDMRQLCETKLKIVPTFVDNQNAGIIIDLDKPAEVGADRLVNAVACLQHYEAPAIIVDLGTATTFDVIDPMGRYGGGVIAPGINLSLQALYQAAEKLPEVPVEKPEKAIGKNTKDAMQSGIYWGYIGLIEGTLNRLMEEMEAKPLVIATGGLAPLFATGTDKIDVIDGDLTLKGLVHIQSELSQKKNRKSA